MVPSNWGTLVAPRPLRWRAQHEKNGGAPGIARLLDGLPVNFSLTPLAASAPHFSQGELAAGLVGRNFVGSISGLGGVDLGR